MPTRVYAVGAEQGVLAGPPSVGHPTSARRKQLPRDHAMPAPTTRGRPGGSPLPHWADVLLSGSLGPAPLHSPELTAGLTSILSPLGLHSPV